MSFWKKTHTVQYRACQDSNKRHPRRLQDALKKRSRPPKKPPRQPKKPQRRMKSIPRGPQDLPTEPQIDPNYAKRGWIFHNREGKAGVKKVLFCGAFRVILHGIIYGAFSKLLCREGQVLPFSQVPSYSYKHGPLSNATMTCVRMFFCDCEASWTNWICWHYRCDKCNSRRIMGQGGDADWTMISLNCKHCSPSYAYFHLVLKTVFFIEEIAGAKRMIYVSIV